MNHPQSSGHSRSVARSAVKPALRKTQESVVKNGELVEPRRIELLTSCVQGRRSPS